MCSLHEGLVWASSQHGSVRETGLAGGGQALEAGRGRMSSTANKAETVAFSDLASEIKWRHFDHIMLI